MLSPILLFTIYNYDLFSGLMDPGIGCYCDGSLLWQLVMLMIVMLLAPSPSALQMMLHYCEEFAGCQGLIFNATKS